jgi:poly(beta-D-mannuronate) lyase
MCNQASCVKATAIIVFARRFLAALLTLIHLSAFGAKAEQRLVGNPDELASAVRAAQPGDEVILRDGLWRDADLLLEGEGTEKQPITLRAATPGKVILTGRSRLRLAGRHLVVKGLWFKDGVPVADDVISFRRSSTQHAQNCRVTDCAITNYNPADRKKDTKWISLYGGHNRVDHCYLAGKENAGATLVVWLPKAPAAAAGAAASTLGTFNHRIDHNHFGPRPALGANGGESIRVGDSATSMSDASTLIERNLFEECNGEVEIISNKSCGNVYRYNTFLRCEGALTLRHGNRCTVAANFFLGNGRRRTGGVRIIGEDHRVYNNYFANLTGEGSRAAISMMNGIPSSPLSGYFQVQRAMVAFNTFVDCRENFVLGLASDNPKGGTLPPKDCTIANNLIVGREAPLVRYASQPDHLRWEANLFHGAALGIPDMPGWRQVDPKLNRADEGLLRPAADSPARGNAAAMFPFVTDDIDGQPRGVKPDIGCDEISTQPPQRRPLTSDEVGPSWPSLLAPSKSVSPVSSTQ